MTKTHFRRLSALLLVGLGVCLPACTKENAGQLALRKAADRLEALTAAGAKVAPAASQRRAGFQQVLDTVRPFRDAESAGQSAAANMLAARALSGIAEIDGAAASEGQRRSLDRAVAIRASLNRYTDQSAASAAAASYDAGPTLAELDKQLRGLDDSSAKRTADKSIAEKKRADLMARAKASMAEAARLRSDAAALRRQAGDGSAVRGLELMEQSAKLSRQADELDRQAAHLQAEADQQTPAIDALQREIDSIVTQRTLTTARRNEIVKRAEAAKTQAAECAAAAAEAAAAIARQVGELAALRSGDLSAVTDRALKSWKESLTAAKKGLGAGTGDRSPAQLMIGGIHQATADVLADQWRGNESFGALLALLAEAKPSLSESAKYQADAKTAKDAAEAALKEAKQAYQEAIDAYGAARVGDKDVSARIDRIKEILKNLSEGNYSATAATAAATVPAAAPTPVAPVDGGDKPAPTPGNAEGDVAAIRAVLDQYHDALRKGDMNAFIALMKTDSPEDQATLVNVTACAKSGMDLDKACQAKFGKSLSDIASNGPMGPAAGSLTKIAGAMSKDLNRTSADYEITVEGPAAATASLKNPGPNEQRASPLVKDGGRWLIHIGRDQLGPLGAMSAIFKPLGEAFASLATDVSSGKIGTEQAFNAALMQRMAPIMMKLQPPGGPGPGGGR